MRDNTVITGGHNDLFDVLGRINMYLFSTYHIKFV